MQKTQNVKESVRVYIIMLEEVGRLLVIPEGFEPPVRILRATIPRIGSQSKFRIVRGKVILQPQGKEFCFLHDAVRTFLHHAVTTFLHEMVRSSLHCTVSLFYIPCGEFYHRRSQWFIRFCIL